MSTEYSDRKIKEILAKVNGQAKLAEQAIATLAQRDPQFLHSLVFPYLNGIISHGIERARKSTGVKEPTASQALPKRSMTPKPTAPKPVPMSGNTMDNLMKAWAKGFEKDAPPAPSGSAVSKSHVAAINALIKKK